MNRTPKPPTDDPTLPSYECPSYRANKASWQLLADCWKGGLNKLGDRATEYLPKNYCEHPSEYQRRLSRSKFDNLLRPTIQGYAGAFSKFEIDSSLPENYWDDIDLRGNSIKTLVDRVVQLSARDKYCFLFPQFWQGNSQPRNKAEEIASGRRPFMGVLEAIQVPNWSLDSSHHFAHISIAEQHILNQYSYGAEFETLYRVIRRDNGRIVWELLRLIAPEKSSQGKWSIETVSRGEITRNGQSLSQIPIVPVCLTSLDWSNTEEPMPFLEVAELNVLLYQIQSDRREVEYKCVPTLGISLGPGSTVIDDQGNITMGSYLNLGNGGSASIIEASGNGIPHLFQEEENVRASIRKSSLEFVSNTGPERKEVQVKLDLQDIQTNLERMANMLESSLQSAFKLLGEYVGMQDAGSINIAVDMSVFLFNIQDLAAAVAGKFLSRETAIKRMVQIGYADDAEEELELILGAEKAEAQTLASAFNPVQNDEDVEL